MTQMLWFVQDKNQMLWVVQDKNQMLWVAFKRNLPDLGQSRLADYCKRAVIIWIFGDLKDLSFW